MSNLDNSFRQRLGSRIERHVMRSAVDMLDERGTELDTVERQLQLREANLIERTANAEEQESELEHRERRLAELGADDISGQPRIDHLIRQLDRAEMALGQVRAEARQELAAAQEHARELHERVKRLEEADHRRLLTQADLTRREATVSSRQYELREQDDMLRRRAQDLEAKQQGLLAHERRLAERERRADASEAELRKRLDAQERRERDLEEREDALRGRDNWWGVTGPASSH
jgi:chromosome segregation ATPase